MDTKATVNGKRLFIHQLSKHLSTPDPPVKTTNPDVPATDIPAAAAPAPPPAPVSVPAPAPAPASTVPPANKPSSQKVVAPKTRIVVVRAKSSAKNEKGEEVEMTEAEQAKSVELPPLLTDGRTSVYLIRRPIPPSEPIKKTEIFKRPKESRTTSRKKPTSNENSHDVSTIDTGDESLPTNSRTHSPSRTSRAHRIRSARLRADSPSHDLIHPGPANTHENPLVHFETPETPARRSRSKDRSRPGSSMAHRSLSKGRSPSPPDSREQEYRTVQYLRPKIVKPDQQKQSIASRIKSGKSFTSVNPDDQKFTHGKRESGRPVTKQPTSMKKTRFETETDGPLEKRPVDPLYCHRCLLCLSRHICLLAIICVIIFLIGLAGAGVSVYFLANGSTTQTAAEIVGIVVGVLVAIAALCFLFTVMTCVGSCEGYFTFHGEGPRGAGRSFGFMPPSQSNDRLYVPSDSTDLKGSRRSSPSTPVSPVSTTQIQPISRQKTVANEATHVPNGKNITIEMPERLLTGGRMSPTTHERSLSKVVKNIGHVVQDASKRYNGDVPSKVIVQVDPNAKAAV